jgi:hypothetical protein
MQVSRGSASRILVSHVRGIKTFAGAVGSVALLGLLCSTSFAQNGKPSIMPTTPPRAIERPTDYKVPLLTQPLRLADFADMGPRDGLKDQLLRIGGFTQHQPNNDKPPTQETEVYVGRTQSTLYFVFVCHDDHPGEIRTHMARRENVTTDDNVTVLLDPFQDKRKGVLFQINPNGVQADAEWTEGNGADYSYDTVWDSEGRVTRSGWMGLIAIPFRSLRRWGQLGRGIHAQHSARKRDR